MDLKVLFPFKKLKTVIVTKIDQSGKASQTVTFGPSKQPPSGQTIENFSVFHRMNN